MGDAGDGCGGSWHQGDVLKDGHRTLGLITGEYSGYVDEGEDEHEPSLDELVLGLMRKPALIHIDQ